MYENIVVHLYKFQKCGNFQCSIINYTFQGNWMEFLLKSAFNYKYLNVYKCIPKYRLFSIIFQYISITFLC